MKPTHVTEADGSKVHLPPDRAKFRQALKLRAIASNPGRLPSERMYYANRAAACIGQLKGRLY